jgi:hypothetical protein
MLWPRAERIIRENYDRIRMGMNWTEVADVLGPPGDFTTGRIWPPPAARGLLDVDRGTDAAEWKTDRILVRVEFTARGTVVGRMCALTSRIEQGPIENLLWQLKRQWHGWFP